MKDNKKPMKNQSIEKNTGKLENQGKPRGNNRSARKSINSVAKPMNMWKNDGEYPPTQRKKHAKKNIAKSIPCPYKTLMYIHVLTMYIQCIYNVYTMYIQCTYNVYIYSYMPYHAMLCHMIPCDAIPA